LDTGADTKLQKYFRKKGSVTISCCSYSLVIVWCFVFRALAGMPALFFALMRSP
jgi:hypothetical protein